jgi:hypothetical protein
MPATPSPTALQASASSPPPEPVRDVGGFLDEESLRDLRRG